MIHLIVGLGEIGHAVMETLTHAGHEIYTYDNRDTESLGEIVQPDVLHICFPYSDDFEQFVQGYINFYRPKHTIIYSTLPIGTTRRIGRKVIHSPIEGKHPELALSVHLMERWIGYNSRREANFFSSLFEDLGLRIKLVKNSDHTEALKLLSTTEYGINIEFARYKKQVADAIGMDYQLTKDWNEEYNRLYQSLGMGKQYQKFVLDAPEGPKGGHCVVPNARLLAQQCPNELVTIVGEL